MGSLETIFGTVVVVLAALAVVGALVVVLVAEVYAVKRTIERHRKPDPYEAFWRSQRALTEPKP